MTYWLQELQQKRWEYCNGLDMVKWDSRTSPTLGDFSKGLVARDATGESKTEGPVSVPGISPLDTASQRSWEIQNEVMVVIPCDPYLLSASVSRIVFKPSRDLGSEARPVPSSLQG